MLSYVLFLLTFVNFGIAKTVTYNWNVGWIWTAPVGGTAKPVIGINGAWPCPQLDATVGDRVIVNVCNNLGNQSTTIHWHGIRMNGTNDMDGVAGVTQCPIAPGQTFTYEFEVHQPGTFWYHSHVDGQYPDGLWGPLIVHDPNPPFKFDEEFTIALADWWNEPMSDLIHHYQSPAGEALDGTPEPSGGAVYGYWGKFAAIGKNLSIPILPGKTYMVRLICAAGYPGLAWVMVGHNQTVVEIDGTYVEPVDVNKDGLKVRLAPGQRQASLIHTKNTTDQNFALWSIMDLNILIGNKQYNPFTPYWQGYDSNVTAWLTYNSSAPKPAPPVYASIENKDFYDDLDYRPLDKMPPLEPVNHRIVLNTTAQNISHISRFLLNNQTYLGASVPSLYTALTVPAPNISNPAIYGPVLPIVLKYNDVVELVINNQNQNLHPWHLHGHEFQILDRPDPLYGDFNGTYTRKISTAPVRRDSLMLQDKSWAVIRFRANNPGVWLWHCHIEMHVISGLTVTFIVAPERIVSSNKKPSQRSLDICKAFPMPFEGNAVGKLGGNLEDVGPPMAVPAESWGAMYPPGSKPYVVSGNMACKA
jgi:iron transport multicopper oxidase